MALAIRELNPAQGVSERHLVTAVRRGDDRAFELLFERYRRRIGSYVYGLVRDAGRAEDITQEIFISALRRLRATERPIAFKPWIYEIARNACIDEYRRSARAAIVSLDEEDENGFQGAPLIDDVSPHVEWERKQQLHDLLAAFSGLSDTHHRMLVMRELEGLSYDEIADRLGISVNMVESTLFRARRRLSSEYDELTSGRQCERVRAAIDGLALRAARSPGIRERRRIGTHLEHCTMCLRHARDAGIDESLLRTPAIAERVAALLPVGWLPVALRRFLARHSNAAARGAALSETAPPVAVSRAIAATAAVVIAGGAFTVAEHRHTGAPHHVVVPVATAPVAVQVALPLNVAAAQGAEPVRVLPAAVMANLAAFRAAMLNAARANAAQARQERRAHARSHARALGSHRGHGAPTPPSAAAGAGRPSGGASATSTAGASPAGAATASTTGRPPAGRPGGPTSTGISPTLPTVPGVPAASLVGAAKQTVSTAAGAVTQTAAAAGGVVTQATGAAGQGISGTGQVASSVATPVTQAGQAAGAAVTQTGAAAGAAIVQTGQALGQVATTTDQAVSAATSLIQSP